MIQAATHTNTNNEVDVFSDAHLMSVVDAKHFIDDAYAKRDRLRALTKLIREHGCVNDVNGVTCIHKAYFNEAFKEYRQAHKWAVRAYNKCMADISKTKSRYY
jgi:hypothetical protein